MKTRKTHRKPVVPSPPATPSIRPGRRPSAFEVDLGGAEPAPRRIGDHLSLALITLAGVALAALMFGYVFEPALSTLTDASVATWSGEGP